MVLFIYDMIAVRPRISYDINGRNITKNEDMLRHYLTHYFGIDFLGVLVIIVSFLPIRHIDYLRFAFFLKIIPLKEIHKQIKFRLLVKRNASAIYDFFRLTFLIMFITNFCSCIYFAIDYYFYRIKASSTTWASCGSTAPTSSTISMSSNPSGGSALTSMRSTGRWKLQARVAMASPLQKTIMRSCMSTSACCSLRSSLCTSPTASST